MIYRLSVNFVLNQLEVVFGEYVQNEILVATDTKIYQQGDESIVAEELGEPYVVLLSFLSSRQKMVPLKVSMRQARLALLNAGLLGKVEEELVDSKDLIEWEYATEVYRSSPLVQLLKEQLNLSEVQLDDLFLEASKL